MFKALTDRVIRDLEKIAGEKNVICDPEKIIDYGHDEFSLSDIAREPDVVVKPKSTEEVSRICRLANEEKIPVTPRGGATGLCGGCVPSSGGIVLSLERMNRIVEVDRHNQMIVAESGVMLMDFYPRIEEEGLFFPPHPGDETAMIGGIIATNAGGSRAVKYGVVRNYVRGLEVVLPSGGVVNLGGKLMKSSTGYNLLNLMIGSEGTLGIITKATIQLMPSPQMSRSLIIPYDNLEQAIDTVPELMAKKIVPLAVEFIPKEVIQITENIKAHTLEILDIAVPRAEIARHVKRVQEVSREYGIWLPTFGHAADGNVHTHIMKARYEDGKILPLPEEDWKDRLEHVRRELYRDCKERGGVISGEHGIGIVKKPYLSYVLDEESINLMRGIKRTFDPNNILNPGKIFDL